MSTQVTITFGAPVPTANLAATFAHFVKEQKDVSFPDNRFGTGYYPCPAATTPNAQIIEDLGGATLISAKTASGNVVIPRPNSVVVMPKAYAMVRCAENGAFLMLTVHEEAGGLFFSTAPVREEFVGAFCTYDNPTMVTLSPLGMDLMMRSILFNPDECYPMRRKGKHVQGRPHNWVFNLTGSPWKMAHIETEGRETWWELHQPNGSKLRLTNYES